MNLSVEHQSALPATTYFAAARTESRGRGSAAIDAGEAAEGWSSDDDAAGVLCALGGWDERADQIGGLVQTLRDLEMQTARENWDDERGVAIEHDQWMNVSFLLVAALVNGFPVPHVGAAGDGFVHVTWFNAVGDRLVAEVGRSKFFLSMLGASGDDTTTEYAFLEAAVQAVLTTSFDAA